MFGTIWHTFFFDPVYNGLVFFIDVIPGGDVGLAIICTTVVVKLILLPLSVRAVKTQVAMREIEPRLKELKEKIKDKQEQAKAMMDLYREAGVNPLASVFLMFIQIPIIIALYISLRSLFDVDVDGLTVVKFNIESLYNFVSPPDPNLVSHFLFGIVDITAKSLPLALLAGVTQFFQTNLSLPKLPPKDPDKPASMKDDFARNMQLQMRYVLPVMITFVAYSISAAIALYFFVSNIMGLIQELHVRKHRKPVTASETE